MGTGLPAAHRRQTQARCKYSWSINRSDTRRCGLKPRRVTGPQWTLDRTGGLRRVHGLLQSPVEPTQATVIAPIAGALIRFDPRARPPALASRWIITRSGVPIG